MSRSRPRFSISSNSTVGRSLASSRARSSSAPRPAYASTQPVEAAVAAAAAGLRADVPDLAGRATARELPAVHHDATADPGAPEHTEERVEPATGAEAVLGLDRHVDVVADPHGPPSSAASVGPSGKGHPTRRCSRTWSDGARLGVDRAGSADADPGEPHRLHTGIVERRAQGLGELEDDRLRPALAGRLASRAAEHHRLAVGHDRLDLRPAEVEPALHPRHDSHRTTSSIGLRFARALHSVDRVQLRIARPLRAARTRGRSPALVLGRIEHGARELGDP